LDVADPDRISAPDHLRRLEDLRDEIELLRRHMELARPLGDIDSPPQPKDPKQQGNPPGCSGRS
jgi:hypothetical protein